MRWLALLAILVGCGEDSIDFDDYRDELLDAQCSYLVRCGLFANATECRAYFERSVLDDPNPAAGIEAGKIDYDGAAAQRCADSIRSASCDGTSETARNLDADCTQIFVGHAAAGASCVFDAECESLQCVVTTCTMACCTGTCAPPRALAQIGESCANVDCVRDAYCGSDEVCHTFLPAGAICDAPDACEYGLYCVGTTNQTCKVLPKLGEACPDGICRDVGAVCSTGTCVEAGLPGDPCTATADCSRYYTCDGVQCAPHPTRGQPCTFTCSDDSWCNTSVCDARKANGATCMRNDECATHYCQRIGTPAGTCSDVPLCF